MTRDEAQQLEQGDKVQLSNDRHHLGTVIKISPFTVWVQWPSGAVVSYGKDTMPHIEPARPNNP